MSALPKEQDDGALQIQKNFLHGSVFIVHFVLVPFSPCSIRSVWCGYHCVSILLTWCALCWRSQSVTVTLILLQGISMEVLGRGWGSGMVVVMLTAINSRPWGRHTMVLFFYVEYKFQNNLCSFIHSFICVWCFACVPVPWDWNYRRWWAAEGQTQVLQKSSKFLYPPSRL